MIIKKISINNFRLFNSLNLNFNKKKIIFFGNNGSGKTSILEAIYLLDSFKSFKLKNLNKSINFENDEANISFEVIENQKIEIDILQKNKKIKVNNKKIEKTSDYKKNFSFILFTPQDLEIIDGPVSYKRKWIDKIIFNIDSEYLKQIKEYNKIYNLRKKYILENKADNLIFKTLTDDLISICKIINNKRNIIINLINDEIKEKQIKFKYKSNFNSNFNKEDLLKKEIKFKKSLISKNTDKIDILFKDKDVKDIFSQGEKKELIINFKKIEYKILKSKDQKVITVFDDIYSFLDKKRIENLNLNDFDQVFITITNFDLENNKKIVNDSETEIYKVDNKKVVLQNG